MWFFDEAIRIIDNSSGIRYNFAGAIKVAKISEKVLDTEKVIYYHFKKFGCKDSVFCLNLSKKITEHYKRRNGNPYKLNYGRI